VNYPHVKHMVSGRLMSQVQPCTQSTCISTCPPEKTSDQTREGLLISGRELKYWESTWSLPARV